MKRCEYSIPGLLCPGLRYGIIFLLATLVVMVMSMGNPAAETYPVKKTAPDESPAVFEDALADFEESEADFEDESENASGVTTIAQERVPGLNLPAKSLVLHSEPYEAPRYFPERQPRMVQGRIHHAWIIPFIIALGMIPIVAGQRQSVSGDVLKKVHSRPLPRTRAQSTRRFTIFIIAAALGLLTASPSQAIVYSSTKDAVTNEMGSGHKIYQTTIEITPEIATILKKNLGWSPDQKSYKVYYSKADDGTPQRYAFILSDKLEICGGLHKYCVAINADGTVYDVSILELTCDRSYCINTRSFLSQFNEFNMDNQALKSKSYDAMSGATLSTDLTRDIVQRALALMTVLNGQSHG